MDEAIKTAQKNSMISILSTSAVSQSLCPPSGKVMRRGPVEFNKEHKTVNDIKNIHSIS
jgi:hypothetical protein